ncbi:Flp family type IVb pilin [Falsiroseomonas sp. E2-1-a4]|uniref:Flp family type IVb pilin n=1 Tax=Falsiroseomonas sp. E2-1-a4 TaxID=3239299 RepID=UPI003F304CC1
MWISQLLAARDRLVSDEKGVTALEYGLIAATTVVAIIAALAVIGPALTGIFTEIGTALTG